MVTGRFVLDEAPVTCSLENSASAPDWMAGLSLAEQPRAHLFALYNGWIACVEAILAAKISGSLALPPTPLSRKPGGGHLLITPASSAKSPPFAPRQRGKSRSTAAWT